MGGAFGKLTPSLRSITREDLLRSTNNNRDFMNKLFQVMLERITPEDYLKLGKSQSCSAFVFLMADTIQRTFRDLRIKIGAKQDGTIYFQKMDDLKKPSAENRDLCVFVAYFFVRMFQIFGAIAVTILDDPGAGQVLGAAYFAPPPAATPKRGFFGLGPAAPRRLPGQIAPVMIGGAEKSQFTGEARKFVDLSAILDNPIPRAGKLTSWSFTEDPSILLVPGRKSYKKERNLIFTDANIDVTFGYNRPLGGTLANITLTAPEYVFPKDDTTPKEVQSRVKEVLAKIGQKSYTIETTDGGLSWHVKGDSSKSIVALLTEYKTYVLDLIRRVEANPAIALEDLGLGRARAADPFGLGVGRGVRRAGDAAAVAARAPDGYASVGVIKPLTVDYLVQALKQMAGHKVTSYCVARGLQLLDAQTLYNPRAATRPVSHACLAFDKAGKESVPQPGLPLYQVTGLRAVEQLFHTRPSTDDRHEFRLDKTPESDDEYAKWLTDVAALYGKSTTATPKDLGQIASKEQCDATLKHVLGITDPKAKQALLGIVGKMFARQLDHTTKAVNFLRTRLFSVRQTSGGRELTINPKILANPIAELEVLSRDTRNILIAYYKGCEEMFQEGVKVVVASKPSILK